MGKFSLLQMAKYFKIIFAIWSHCQLQNGFSELYDVIAQKNYQLLYEDTSKIKKVSLRNISIMDDARCREYGQLAKLVRPIVVDKTFYKLSLLLLLTNASFIDPDR